MRRVNLMAKNLRLILILAAFTTLAFMPWPALGAGPETVQITVLMTGGPPTMLPVGDDSNHFVGMGQRKGKARFSDGRDAEYSNVFLVDVLRGSYAKVWGYTKMVFKDDSWIFFKWQSQATGRDKQGKLTFSGTGELQKGTGAYEGIQGGVKFSNRNLPPSEEFPKGAIEAKATLTYTLP